MSLETSLCGVKLRNPTVLSSGILGTSGSILKRVAKAGAGAVTTKSLGLGPRTGWKNPILCGYESGMINAVGLANPGYGNFSKEIKIGKEGGSPVIASIFGSSPEEYAKIASAVEGFGADMIELNVSCPNTEKKIICTDTKLVAEADSKVQSKVNIPAPPKLRPNVNDIEFGSDDENDAVISPWCSRPRSPPC